jgi:hypothetical protein
LASFKKSTAHLAGRSRGLVYLSALSFWPYAMLHALCPLRSFVKRANFFRDDILIQISRPLSLFTKRHAKKIDPPAFFWEGWPLISIIPSTSPFGSGFCWTFIPACFLAQYPRPGLGMLFRLQIFANPTSEIPHSFARLQTGRDQTFS